jgi:mRNA (guanine-N7-)-methyltransferase
MSYSSEKKEKEELHNNTTENTNEKRNPKKDLEEMVSMYLASNPILKRDNKTNEMEIRFGTHSKMSKPITKIEYEKVVKQLFSSGFKSNNINGTHMLRIKNEYIEPRSGLTKISNIRAEIVGLDLIQEYCKTNSIQKIIDKKMIAHESGIKFTKKTPPMINNKYIRHVEFTDLNFRVSYELEEDFGTNANVARGIISNWTDSKKVFRYINRVRFSHPELPLYADISIIKMNRKTGKVYTPQYTIQDADLFNTIEFYDVELEINNSMVGNGTPYNTKESLIDAIRKGVRIILSALQGTNYPIPYSEQGQVIDSYLKLIYGKDHTYRNATNRNFIGPSSVTLKLDNIVEDVENTFLPNIRKNYTVTDKADGDRRLMYISDNGRIYMIDTNMNVIFTGTMTNEKTLFNSLFDGEHIKYDRTGKYINLYAAFDIYYVNGKSLRELAFMKIPGEEEEVDNKYRLLLLMKSIHVLNPYSILDSVTSSSSSSSSSLSSSSLKKTNACNFTITCKTFYSYSEEFSIFDGCAKILSDIKSGIYQYNTDGLIFTPSNTGVGSNRVGVASKLGKITWDMSFKWKPAEFNTIDFLVSVKKDKTGKDEVFNIFQNGKNMNGLQHVVQYKTLILRCGFSEDRDGFINPYQSVIDNDIPIPNKLDEKGDSYKPVPFQPTNPYDPFACFCNIILHENEFGQLYMKTEEIFESGDEEGELVDDEGKVEGGEYFEEDMIVEFRYDVSLEGAWRWVPIRVRYDKTAELRSGASKNYGNSYQTANNNWQSIHNPITEKMIMSGTGFPEYIENEDVYYNRYGHESNTKSLRNFHNLYVKKKLIQSVSERKHTLIDFAVGKGGDLSKWRESKLGFVFGIDISKDNIHNNLDGACARYLKDCKKFDVMPGALFVNGNSALNIRNGDAFMSDKDKSITKAIFGNGPKDRKILGEGVYNKYGIVHGGFNIGSCQFALHYFFENPTTFHSFIRNLAESICMGGHFIGTCYDGSTVFQLLKQKMEGDSMVIMKDDKKIYEITKNYSQTGFPDDETSLGYPISVYQESINKVFVEYLVNFNYFVRIMEDYGFILISKEEAKNMQLPNATGMFNELYSTMQHEIRRMPNKNNNYGDSSKMSEEEKRISFLNRYFIFKKVRTIENPEKMFKIISALEDKMDNVEDEYADNQRDSLSFSKKAVSISKEKENSVEKVKKPTFIRKIKKSFVLDEYSPIVESVDEDKVDKNIIVLDVEELDRINNTDNEVIIIKKRKKKPVVANIAATNDERPELKETVSLELKLSPEEVAEVKKKRAKKEDKKDKK